jgi:hypothetical protein
MREDYYLRASSMLEENLDTPGSGYRRWERLVWPVATFDLVLRSSMDIIVGTPEYGLDFRPSRYSTNTGIL